MLSIEPLKSADGATKYYMDVVNYYQNDAKSMRWLGAGAQILGLYGQSVDRQQMHDLLSGKLPNGQQLGRIEDGKIKHRLGFDMTVTAPKSFAILLESGADPRLGDIFHEAVERFTKDMEKEFAQTRVLVDGRVEYQNTRNFLIAAFREPSTRAGDPGTHCHLVVMNATAGEDDKWRSLASDMNGKQGVIEQIMKHHIYGGLKLRNDLANRTKELGYTLKSDGDGFWEIASVPDEVIKHYSKRREEIEADMKESGLHGAKGASIASKRTRAGKVENEITDFKQWQKDIHTTCHNMGFDIEKAVKDSYMPKETSFTEAVKQRVLRLFYGERDMERLHAKEAVHIAIESVSQMSAAFSLRDLKKEALKHVIASNYTVDEKAIDKVIQDNIREETLYNAQNPYTKEALLTTPWQLTLESETVARIENGKNKIAPICSNKFVSQFVAQKESELAFALSSSQKRAIASFLTTKDRFIAIQGFAGTGKTTMMKLAKEMSAIHGYDIRGITAGSSAAHELETKGNIDARTFARELSRLKSLKGDLSKTIFVVDEGSMLSNPQFHKIIKLVDDFGAQLKAVGDKAQLPTPSSGKPFAIAQEYGIHTTEMTDNLRQKDPDLKESAIHAGRGEIFDAIQKLTHVEELETYDERVQFLAQKWLSLSKVERDKTLCFAPRHTNRRDITQIMRATLKEESSLQGDAYHQDVLKERAIPSIKLRECVYYKPNDVIRFNLSIPRYGIRTGDYLTVGTLSEKNKAQKSLPLSFEGKKINFHLKHLPEFRTENKDLERPIEVYYKDSIELLAGDKIQFKRNNESLGIHNSNLGVVTAIIEDALIIKNLEDKEIVLKKGSMNARHIDHGYVLTTYASQGKDEKRGLSLLDSVDKFATNISNFYVTTTRAISEMTVITDNKENLIRAIAISDSEKYSSLETTDARLLSRHNERFKDHRHSLELQNVIAKKLSKEDAWQGLEDKISAYADTKKEENKALAATLAHEIVKNPNLYRLSRMRLGFTSQTYRRDAFKYETLAKFTELSENEKGLFSDVKRYVRSNQKIASLFGHLKEYDSEIKSLDESKIEDAKAYKAQVYAKIHDFKVKRNGLASKIADNLEVYKPHLAHYSIGQLNRIGLLEYELYKETKNAESRLEKLGGYSAHDALRQKVFEFASGDLERSPQTALQIKRDSKLAHPYVLEVAKLLNKEGHEVWRDIHKSGSIAKNALFRQGLSPESREIFDMVAEFSSVRFELQNLWTNQARDNPENIKEIFDNAKFQSLDKLKNTLSAKILETKGHAEILSYFKISPDLVSKNALKHQHQENVTAYANNKGDFKAKLLAVSNINQDIKGHYPSLLNSQVDMKVLGRYLKVVQRQEYLKDLPKDEREAYKSYLSYEHLARSSSKCWQMVYQEDASKNAKNNLIFKAKSFADLRDQIAFELKSSPYLEQILQHEGKDKDKILERAALYANKLALSHDSSIIPNTRFPSKEPNAQVIIRQHETLDAATINEALMSCPETSYPSIFGEPKSKNTQELRYSGGLVVILKGDSRGLWYDFVEGKGGSPIQAIMRERGVDFLDALKIGSEIAGINNYDFKMAPTRSAPTQNQSKNLNDLKNKSQIVKSIWGAGIDLKGTLAERYLKEHRGIELDNLDARFLPKGASHIDLKEGQIINRVNKIPAIVYAARDSKGDLTGLQRIYLDPKTGGKNPQMQQAKMVKLSKGVITGSAVLVQKGMRGSPLYIAEGFETAGSIAMAVSHATVIASLGIDNMKNLDGIIKKYQSKNVIIAADNDGENANTHKKISTIIESYQNKGVDIKAIYPEMLEGKKTDWNDVLLKKGVQEIKNQVFNQNSFSQKTNEVDSLDRKDLEKIKFDSFVKSENINISFITETTKNLNHNINRELIKNIEFQPNVSKSVSKSLISVPKNIEKEMDL